LKGQLLPHPYQTRVTSSEFDIRRGAMNVVFMDGSVGVVVYTPSGTAKLSGG
jgi:prepilin-type processing-associated H-X9-DG protein